MIDSDVEIRGSGGSVNWGVIWHHTSFMIMFKKHQNSLWLGLCTRPSWGTYRPMANGEWTPFRLWASAL